MAKVYGPDNTVTTGQAGDIIVAMRELQMVLLVTNQMPHVVKCAYPVTEETVHDFCHEIIKEALAHLDQPHKDVLEEAWEAYNSAKQLVENGLLSTSAKTMIQQMEKGRYVLTWLSVPRFLAPEQRCYLLNTIPPDISEELNLV